MDNLSVTQFIHHGHTVRVYLGSVVTAGGMTTCTIHCDECGCDFSQVGPEYLTIVKQPCECNGVEPCAACAGANNNPNSPIPFQRS